jgi:acyl carrier protein
MTEQQKWSGEMTDEAIARVLTTIVRRVNGTDPAVVTPEQFRGDARLYEDLDVDSLAMVELAEDLEDRFGVNVEEDDLRVLRTFGALTEYVESIVQ